MVIHCLSKVWPVLWSVLDGSGLNRDNTDEGTLLLSLNLPNDSNGVPRVRLSCGTSCSRPSCITLIIAKGWMSGPGGIVNLPSANIASTYSLQSPVGKGPANVPDFRRSGWPGLAVWGRVLNWNAY